MPLRHQPALSICSPHLVLLESFIQKQSDSQPWPNLSAGCYASIRADEGAPFYIGANTTVITHSQNNSYEASQK